MKCPYCNKQIIVPDIVTINVESYGSKRCRFPCNKCNKIVSMYGERTVRFYNIKKTDKESDW